MKTIPICLLFTLLAGFFSADAQVGAQSCPPNLDFEDGNFSNWQSFIGKASVSGTNTNVITLAPATPTAGRHEIINTSASPRKDRYGNFPVFCPYGGGYSVKLGNDQSGGEAEGLSYTFTLPTTVDTFTFTYYYAVVFQDPAHLLEQQPRFFVTAYDVATGEVINCASYDYVANGTLPGFQKSTLDPMVLYKNWSPTSLQFANMGGKTVRLEFKTADCTLGGHFGYAYVDVGSGCSNILATAPYCAESNSLILNAPYGYKTYTWYNEDFSKVVGNQQSITFTPAPVTKGVFQVDVIPYPGYGCRDTLYATVNPLPFPETLKDTTFVFCQNNFAGRLDLTPAPGNDVIWYTGDTLGIGTDIPPLPSTSKAGVTTYYASQKTLFGCESFKKKMQVHIVPTPVASFTTNTRRQCEGGNRFIFSNTTTNRSNCTFNWDFGDGTKLSSTSDTAIIYTYQKSGNYQVVLHVVSKGSCSSRQSTQVTVVPKPTAKFGYPSTICENQTAVAVVDQSFVPGSVANVSKWWWNFNGTILQLRTPPAFVPDKGGVLSIKMVVATDEGCLSDTASVLLPVYYQPRAAITHKQPFCNNEAIDFKDASGLPANAAGESIIKWHWQISNVVESLQHPTVALAPGTHHAQLIAETNFGCKSKMADSLFEVHPKPTIALSISDSCVLRTIQYKASDKDNTVQTWYWDFGTGLRKGNAAILKTYAKEGDHPLTLIGQTINGCKDTLVRPFTIYDNKAFAGRDTITAMGEPVHLNAKGGTNNTYFWSPSTGLDNPAIEQPVAVLNEDQLYQLDAITKEGCDSHSKILIKRFKGPMLYIATAFTPNKDGKNDVLSVFPVGIKSFHYMAVYNRYGEMIFKTADYSKGWDGTYKGALLSTATFVVVAEATDYKGKKMLQKGTVTLIR